MYLNSNRYLRSALIRSNACLPGKLTINHTDIPRSCSGAPEILLPYASTAKFQLESIITDGISNHAVYIFQNEIIFAQQETIHSREFLHEKGILFPHNISYIIKNIAGCTR